MSGNLPNSNKVSLSSNAKLIIAFALILLGVLARFMPHPPNFAPIAAIALFAGVFLPRRWAIALPLAAMIVSDIFIGMHGTIAWTWGSFVIIALISSSVLKKHYSLNSVLLSSIGASIFFYLVTNFGVWAEGLLYPPTLEGLISSYVNAIPFFRNTIVGDMFYVVAIFGAYELAIISAKQLKSKLSFA